MAEIITVGNITYNFINETSDLVSDEDNIGIAYLTIPGSMGRRFARECGFKNYVYNRLIFPHYDLDGMRNFSLDSDHDCYNTDTQIVLMNWLHNKQRKYKLDYRGIDPYWIFHDHFHSKNDVYRGEVQGIWSALEHERLLQGADLAHKKGHSILPETAAKLIEAWIPRWRFQERERIHKLNEGDFYPFMDIEARDQLEYYLACGTFSNNKVY